MLCAHLSENALVQVWVSAQHSACTRLHNCSARTCSSGSTGQATHRARSKTPVSRWLPYCLDRVKGGTGAACGWPSMSSHRLEWRPGSNKAPAHPCLYRTAPDRPLPVSGSACPGQGQGSQVEEWGRGRPAAAAVSGSHWRPIDQPVQRHVTPMGAASAATQALPLQAHLVAMVRRRSFARHGSSDPPRASC